MSRIKDLLLDKDSVLVFDVDGVLAKLEWGEYNHYAETDEEWNKLCDEGINTYTEDKVSKKMQDFLRDKDMDRVFVLTTVGTENEVKFKKDFLKKYYNILEENIYWVNHNNQKVVEIVKIKEKFPNIEDYKLIMIDDTVEILNDILEKTSYSTAHISSFLDI